MEFVRYAHSAILAKGQFTWRCGTPDRRGRSPHLSCKHYQIKMRDFMDRRVASPNWGSPPPCKRAVRQKKREVSSEVKKKKENCGANLEQPCQWRIVFRRTRKDCSPSDWLKLISLAARQIRSTTQISEVTRHQHGISALIPQTSSEVAKCRLFSRAGWNSTSIFWAPENEIRYAKNAGYLSRANPRRNGSANHIRKI